jgi:hypothetical protein
MYASGPPLSPSTRPMYTILSKGSMHIVLFAECRMYASTTPTGERSSSVACFVAVVACSCCMLCCSWRTTLTGERSSSVACFVAVVACSVAAGVNDANTPPRPLPAQPAFKPRLLFGGGEKERRETTEKTSSLLSVHIFCLLTTFFEKDALCQRGHTCTSLSVAAIIVFCSILGVGVYNVSELLSRATS